MRSRRARASCAAVVAAALAWSAGGVPVLAQGAASQDPVSATIQGDGRFQGKIETATEGKTRTAKGAVISLYEVSTGIVTAAEPTGGSGKFSIDGLRRGYYDVVIEMPDGDTYVANRVLEMKPSAKVVVTLVLTSTAELTPGVSSTAVRFPGRNASVSGIALVKQKKRGKEFWTSPSGLIVIGAAGVLALFAIATSSSSDESTPQDPTQVTPQ